MMKLKRTLGWTFAGLITLLLLVAVAGYVYLKSSSFQSFALRKIAEQADLATGGRAEIGHLDFDLSTLTAHLYNITMHGTEGPGQPPLLHAEELTVRMRVLSALHRQLALRELLLEHPVVHLQVDRNGKNNLPATPPSQNDSSASIFDLAVEHAQLSSGEIYYNDKKIPLDANLYDLGANIRFESLAKRYEGELSYKSGSVHYAQYAPLSHSLNLKFRATAQKFELASATLKIDSSSIDFNAELSNYAHPVADGTYQIQIHTQDFAGMFPSVSPAGDVSLNGRLHYQDTGGPLLRRVSVDGEVSSEGLAAATSGRRVDLRRVNGIYQLAGGNLLIRSFTAESLGGRISATAEVKHLDTTEEANARVLLSDISLSEIQRMLGAQPLQTAVLSGTVSGRADASWKDSITNVRAHSDLLLRARASSRSHPSAQEVPVDGAIHVTYDGSRQTIELRDTTLTLPSATLTAQGSIGDRSSLHMQVIATDLHQLALLSSSFVPSQTTIPAIAGSATLILLAKGSIKKPAITAQLSAANLQVEGSEWKTAKVAMRVSPSEFVIESATLVNARRGSATLAGSIGLHNWSYSNSSPVKANLEVQQLRLTDLQGLAKQHYPVSGDVSAKLSLTGTPLRPAGSGSIQLVNAIAYGEPIQALVAKFRAENGSVVSSLNVSTAAGAVDADLSYTPQTKAYKVRLNAPSVVLEKLQTVKEKSLPVSGTVTASVNGEGTLDNPQLTAKIQLPQLQVRQNSISGLKAEVRVAEHHADLDFDTVISQASIHAHGRVNLEGDYDTDAVIDTGTIPLDTLLAAYVSGIPAGFKGQTELHATLKGPLKDKSRMQAHLSIPVLKATYQSLEIGIPQPIRLDYADSVATLQPVEIRGTGTSLRAQGRIPIGGTNPAMMSAQGSIDVRILQIVVPGLQSSGNVTLDVRSSGPVTSPTVQGQVQFQNVAISTPDAPIGIEKLNGTLDLSNDHLRVTNMTAQVGGGQVSVGGSIAYRPSLQFNLAIQGQSVRLRYPDGLRSVLDANLAFSGTPQASTLNGRVLIDNLSFTPDFDLSKFGDQFSTGNDLSQPGFADTIRLAINVQSQQNLNAISSQISVAGQAALQVGGTAANPVITGRTTLTSGELFYRNVRYQLQKGVITFDDPNETHPVLNVSVTTTVEQYNLTLNLRGPLDKLTTSYVSDPPLATADVINLVARGKTTQEQAASSQSTDSMIASQVAGELSGSLQKLAGISSLQIDPTMGGSNQNSARVAIQQRVTRNLLFSFSTDVSQPGSEIVQGEYQINKRWSVTVQRDQLGGVSVDGRYHTHF
jgi:translocation and assembly module TamB